MSSNTLKFGWKWCHGEPQEKTPRERAHPTEKTTPIIPTEDTADEDTPPPAEYSRVCGLRASERTSKTLTPQEELYDRINHREKIVQIGQNPFHQTNYVQDIEIQDRFLRGKLSGGDSGDK